MSKTRLRFTAMDTWFFRESRPMEALGGSELVSVFPPPVRTLLGAVRTAIGDANGIDWHKFRDNYALRAQIGYGSDDLGALSLSGPWLSFGEKRLYPVPRFLFRQNKDNFARLTIGKPEHTSLGPDRVRLPVAPASRHYKPLEQAWCTREGYEKMLAGKLLTEDDLYQSEKLFQQEARLGIARDNVRRITDDGLLYQTRHLRPGADFAIEVELTHSEASSMQDCLVRLGGEGRLAHINVTENIGDKPLSTDIKAPSPVADTRGLILILLTAARFESQSKSTWIPPGFLADEQNGTRVWKGAINDVPLTLYTAVLGKAQREGGWDMAEHRPRAVQSLIPAGSAYYVTVDGNIADAIEKLHGIQIGEDKLLGRGMIACGLWQAAEFDINNEEKK